MAELDTQDRKRLRSSEFAYIDSNGGEHLPINDEAHIRNAIARFNQTEFESIAAKERARRKILTAAGKHGIEVEADFERSPACSLAACGFHQSRAARRAQGRLTCGPPGRPKTSTQCVCKHRLRFQPRG